MNTVPSRCEMRTNSAAVLRVGAALNEVDDAVVDGVDVLAPDLAAEVDAAVAVAALDRRGFPAARRRTRASRCAACGGRARPAGGPTRRGPAPRAGWSPSAATRARTSPRAAPAARPRPRCCTGSSDAVDCDDRGCARRQQRAHDDGGDHEHLRRATPGGPALFLLAGERGCEAPLGAEGVDRRRIHLHGAAAIEVRSTGRADIGAVDRGHLSHRAAENPDRSAERPAQSANDFEIARFPAAVKSACSGP